MKKNQEKIEDLTDNTTYLLNKIYEFKEKEFPDSNIDMVNLIVSFCEEYDLRVEDIGITLGENKDFLAMFEKDCIENNYLKEEDRSFENTSTSINIEDW